VLGERRGVATNAQMGIAIAAIGDVNDDGVLDLIAGAWGDPTVGPSAGAAEILSGADGALLQRFLADAVQDHFGFAVGAASDVNADGIPDAIVGGWENGLVAFWAGMARVYSGADGAVLHTFYGLAANDKFGGAVGGVGDIDGDGHADLIVGALQEQSSFGAVHIFSGQSGERLARHTGFVANGQMGVWVDGGRDLDGDGQPDYVAGAWLEALNPSTFLAGAAYAWSRRPVRLIPERPRYPLLAGGSGGLILDAGAERAGELFLVAGSVLAPNLGAPPLAPWPLGLVDAAQTVLVATAGGVLDGVGRANLVVVVPPATVALVGSQLLRIGFVGVNPGLEDTSQLVRFALVP